MGSSRMMNRIKSIYIYIREQGTVTTNELTDEFGTSARTIQRALKILEFNNLVENYGRGKWTARKAKVS